MPFYQIDFTYYVQHQAQWQIEAGLAEIAAPGDIEAVQTLRDFARGQPWHHLDIEGVDEWDSPPRLPHACLCAFVPTSAAGVSLYVFAPACPVHGEDPTA
jgi:leucyl aminopeptidase